MIEPTMRERSERLEREAEQRGREISLGLGRERGIERGLSEVPSTLRSLGVSDELIEEAVAAAREDAQRRP